MLGFHPTRRFLRVCGYDLVMEFIEGVSLHEKRDYPMRDLLRFYREAAIALGSLHAHYILHADLKPQHIFIEGVRSAECGMGSAERGGAARDDSAFLTPHSSLRDAAGHVKILDFGQARFYTDPAPRIQGTVDFMAPEQAKGGSVDPRTDVYGLGAAMYWVLTGELNRPSLSGMGHGIGFTVGYAGRAREVRDKNPECPPALEELILDSCERRPEKRPSSMSDVVARLDTLLIRQPD
jgi:serine/threonine-protein kinase